MWMSEDKVKVGDLVSLGQLVGIVISRYSYNCQVHWFSWHGDNPTWVHSGGVTKLKARKENE